MFKCGKKLPFKPCENPTTSPIRIKFVDGASLADVQKKNIGDFLWDTGDLAEKHGLFTYGWNKKADTATMDDLASATDNKKVILGTAAEMRDGMEWFIEVPNGKYDVKARLKLVDSKANAKKYTEKQPMDFDINEVKVSTAPMGVQDEIVHDKPNIAVKNKEIRLKWVAGVVSLISLEIIPQAEEEDTGAVRKQVAPNTFKGGDCLKTNTKNCLYDESQLTKIKCEGAMVKIGAKATNKDLACM